MRYIVFALWLILFLLLFGFALNNTAMSELYLLGGVSIRAPLVVLLLVFFLGGVVVGFLAMLPTWFRQRIELRHMRNVAQKSGDEHGARTRQSKDVPVETIHSVVQSARTTS